jgi:hypothetical protein
VQKAHLLAFHRVNQNLFHGDDPPVVVPEADSMLMIFCYTEILAQRFVAYLLFGQSCNKDNAALIGMAFE